MKNKQLKIGVILSFLMQFVNITIALLYTPILIRFLGQAEYGLYSLVISIVGYFTILDLGFGSALVVYLTQYRTRGEAEKAQKLCGMFLTVYSIIGIVSFILGIIIIANFETLFGSAMSLAEIGQAKTMILLLLVNVAFSFPCSIFQSIIVSEEKFIFQKGINILQVLLQPVITIPLLWMGYHSIMLAVINLVISFIVYGMNIYYCFKKLKVKLQFGWFSVPLLKEILTFSVFVFIAAIVDKVNFSIDQVILGSVKGTSAVSVYALATNFSTIYIAFSLAINGVLLPKMTKMITEKASHRELSNVFIKVGRVQFLILMLIYTGFILFGQSFITHWVGPNYQDAYWIAFICLSGLSIPLIQNTGLTILQAQKRLKFRSLLYLLIAGLNIAVSIPLAHIWGGIGCAIGTGISLLLGNTLIMNWYYHKKIHLDIPSFFCQIGKMSIPLFVVFGIGLLLRWYVPVSGLLSLLIAVVAYTILYGGSAYFFAMNQEERNLLKQIFPHRKSS